MQSGTRRLTQEEFCGYLENSVGMESSAAKTAGADLFENLDVDEDRELSPSEFFFGFRMMPLSLRQALIDSVPEAVPQQTNAAGYVEGGPTLPTGSEERVAAVKKLFAQLDGGGDGVLDVKEVKVESAAERICIAHVVHESSSTRKRIASGVYFWIFLSPGCVSPGAYGGGRGRKSAYVEGVLETVRFGRRP